MILRPTPSMLCVIFLIGMVLAIASNPYNPISWQWLVLIWGIAIRQGMIYLIAFILFFLLMSNLLP